jgi:hypothetical protein
MHGWLLIERKKDVLKHNAATGSTYQERRTIRTIVLIMLCFLGNEAGITRIIITAAWHC